MIFNGPSTIAGQKGEGSHGGKGKYFVRTLFTKEFEPGSSIGIHEHEGDEEIYYVISGSGVMIVDGERRNVSQGDIVLTKSGSSHGLENGNDGELKIFVACAKLK
jgi:quercetin dioxygenase-like cupin family protein